MTPPDQQIDRQQLRRQLRRRRRALSPSQQQAAARGLLRTLGAQLRFISARHIAFYLAADGEIDPSLLLARALKLGKHCYLPVVTAAGGLKFARYRQGDRLKSNRFGIKEPACRRYRDSRAIDLVLMPLVGFDRNGGRLGMGGGFYDRTFSWQQLHPALAGRQLTGLAHSCQEVSKLALANWDIPIYGLATEKEYLTARSR